MNPILYALIDASLFAIALSTDAFIASLAYGSNKIKIPLSSILIISSICTGVLAVSLLLGSILRPFLPAIILKIVSFSILFILGLTKLLDNAIKTFINKNTIDRQIHFSMFNLNFILNIYATPTEADVDQSLSLSPSESVSLAFALSIDSLAAGVGAALMASNVFFIIAASMIFSLIAIKAGELTGYVISNKIPFQISWISGVILIVLAFFRL